MESSKSVPRAVLCLQGPEGVDAVEAAAKTMGLEIEAVSHTSELLRAITEGAWAATVLSLSADHVDDHLAQRVVEQGTAGAVILTAPAVSLERALLMERVGAVGMLREPPDVAELEARFALVAEKGFDVPVPPSEDLPIPGDPAALVGESPAMGTVFETIARVARSTSTVLVTGESGTGKELVARALHWASDRSKGPFVAVNCAAIPEQLLESELFGHERGAFTGAVSRRVGRFERANSGTLFLDEIGDMSLVLQAKVLRVLEERVVERVGGESVEPIDVRVVAATNQRLDESTRQGRFREDLFFRLAVVELHLPPLRERGSDIRRLALHFAGAFARQHGKPVRAISEAALRRIESGPWPGNVRELRNVMDRAVLLAHGEAIRVTDLRMGSAAPRGSAATRGERSHGYSPRLSLEEVESDHIRRVLDSEGGHMAQAAETLGIHRNTLTRKIKQYGIQPRVSEGELR